MYEIIKLDTEITNRCNAACPQCPRTGTNSGGLSDIMDRSGIYDVPVESFDKILCSAAGLNINKVTYCGNYGDPIMHPKAMEIFEKVAGYGVKYQNIDTNGGVRPTEWWSQLGKIPGMHVTFALDGLEDTNHLYRVKTKWSRIMENVKAFIEAGGTAHWIMIVFKHNEHQVEEAEQLSKKMGFESFSYKLTTRNFNPKVPGNLKVNDYKRKKKDKVIKADIGLPKNPKFQPSLLKDGLIEKPVSCMAENTKQVYLTSDNRILPCCHVQPTMWERKFKPEEHRKEPEFADFIENEKVVTDLTDNTFDTIIKSYTIVYPELKNQWDKRNLSVCNRKCGSNFKNVKVQSS